jgi:putative flavoprotein involved in K+ transport
MEPERYETVIVGGGQAGLATGWHLARLGRSFVILDAGARVGDPWRGRWDTLRLYTPARYSGLPGWPFPADPFHYPTRDEVADYLEAYAARFELPVRPRTRVDRLTRAGDRFVLAAGDRRFEAANVVVAAGAYQRPRVPDFAADLDPGVLQLHSSAYRRPSQLRDGPVLVVGAGNSGAEIAGGGQRRLVHRLPARPRLARPAGARRRRPAPPRPRRRRWPARPLLRRPVLPDLDHLGPARRGRLGRRPGSG